MSNKADIDTLSDNELVELFKNSGNKELVGVLFKRYTHLVFGVCMKYLKDEDQAKDLVMQVFEKLLTGLHKHKIDHFKGWLYMVSKNECLMFLRSKKRQGEVRMHTEIQIESPDDPGHLEGEGSVEFTNMELSDSVHLNDEGKEAALILMEDSIKKLNPGQRQCIELFYLSQKSYEEVSGITGFSMNEVKSYIQNGKRNLKLIMTNRK